MREKNNAPLRGEEIKTELKEQRKSKAYNCPKQEIRMLFTRGGKYTARQLNRLTQSNDARKCISDLRREGLNIVDRRISGGRKEYWLLKDTRQLTLFGEGGAL